MSVLCVVGAQFGSEGKGAIVEKIAGQYGVHIRTGAPNAGHTYFADIPGVDATSFGGEPIVIGGGRKKIVARSVPVGACNHNAQLVIGPGALVDVDLLLEEVRELDGFGLQVSSRILVDERAMVVDPVRHQGFEGGVGGVAHRAIGSTGEGVGPARMGRIARRSLPAPMPAWAHIQSVGSYREELEAHDIAVSDTALFVNRAIDDGADVLLEGTQGSGLSLVHGPWPYVTSTDTNAAQLAVDAGIAPQLVSDVLLVARTFPIRVAGNSGPLPGETTWAEVGVPPEYTTVTKKERRVGQLNVDTVRRAVMLNRPRSIAITFADYVFPELYGADTWEDMELRDRVYAWAESLGQVFGAKIEMIGTGPDTVLPLWPGEGKLPPVVWPKWEDAYGVEVPA